MKMTIAQIMHFNDATKAIAKYIDEQVQALEVKDRGPMQRLVSASETIQRMADSLLQAEVSVKG